jgi:hypothetical protein
LLGRPRGPQRKQQLKKQEFIDQMKEGMLFALTHTAVSVIGKVKSLSLVRKKVCLFFCFYYHSTEISSLQNNLLLVVFYTLQKKEKQKSCIYCCLNCSNVFAACTFVIIKVFRSTFVCLIKSCFYLWLLKSGKVKLEIG